MIALKCSRMRVLNVLLLILMMFAVADAKAEETTKSIDPSTLVLIELLKEKGILSEEEAEQLTHRIESAASKEPEEEKVRIITVIPEEKEEAYVKKISKNVAKQIRRDVREEVKEEIRAEMAREDRELGRDRSVPDWVRRIKWGGDIRLRYQGDYYDNDNAIQFEPSDPAEVMNTRVDRHRYRYRVRLGVNAEVNEKTEVGIRLATGNEDDPVSTNDTLGDMFAKDTITFDRAYLKVTPIQEIELWGGRMPNPFFATSLVWDSDVALEGIAVKAEVPFSKEWLTFFSAGAFPLEEIEMASQDKYLYAGQVGLQYKPRADITWKLGTAYYHYDNVTGKINDPSNPGAKDYTAPSFQQKGNTLFNINPSATDRSEFLLALASEFHQLNITNQIDFAMYYPVHVILTADYVRNLGFDEDDVERRVQSMGVDDIPDDLDEGFRIGLLVGHPKVSKLGQWNTEIYYQRLEGDAVLDAFTDSDFHGGGTNAKGWVLGGQVGVWDNMWLSGKWISTDEIDGPPLQIDTLQIDLNAKF